MYSLVPSILVIGGSVAVTLLSYSFLYGQGHSKRPLLWFLLSYLMIWLGMVWLVRRLGTGGKVSIVLILGVGLLCRVAILPSNLIQENDVYRYVFDGQNMLQGENPYVQSPTEIRYDPTHPLHRALEQPEAKQVLERIGFPEVPTLYPPLAQVTFSIGVLLKGWNWLGQRYLFLILDLLVMALLLKGQQVLGVAPQWIVLWAWNPLVLKEVTNSTHVDVMLCLLVVILVLVIARSSHPISTPAVGGAVLGLLVLTKLYPVIFLPALSFWIYRRFRSILAVGACLGSALAVVIAGYLPFLGEGLRTLFRGLSIYGQFWIMNEGAFSLIAFLTDHARLVSGGLAICFSCLIGWRVAAPTPQGLVRSFQYVLLLWLLLIPTPYPWYFLPLIPLACLDPGSAAARTSAVLSLLIAFYYLSFFFEYRDSPEWMWTLTRTIEHAGIWGCLLFFAWTPVSHARAKQ